MTCRYFKLIGYLQLIRKVRSGYLYEFTDITGIPQTLFYKRFLKPDVYVVRVKKINGQSFISSYK